MALEIARQGRVAGKYFKTTTNARLESAKPEPSQRSRVTCLPVTLVRAEIRFHTLHNPRDVQHRLVGSSALPRQPCAMQRPARRTLRGMAID